MGKVFYNHGQDPWRKINGILYVCQIMMAGLSNNPVSPIAGTAQKVLYLLFYPQGIRS